MAADRFRTQETIVNEQGEFAAPARLHGVEYESRIDTGAVQPEEEFLFDEEPAWEQPISAPPAQRQETPRAPRRTVSSGKGKKRRMLKGFPGLPM